MKNKLVTLSLAFWILSSGAIAQTKPAEQMNQSTPHSTNTNADNDKKGWLLLNSPGESKSTYYLQTDSLKVLKFKEGDALRMTMQTLAGKSIHYSNLFYWVNSCKQKQGELAYFTLSKSQSSNSMVVVGGQDIGSQAVTHMCHLYENYTKNLSSLTSQEQKEMDSWKDIAITDSLITSYKKGTVEKITLSNKKPGIEFSGRVIDLTTKKVALYKWQTSLEECKKESGVIKSHDLTNNKNLDNNYAFHSGSLASLIAEDLCSQNVAVAVTKN